MKYKLNTITRAIIVACFSLASISSFASCEKAIKDFYIAYMQNVEKMVDGANIALKQAYMSTQLIAKIAQETERTDADAILMAQDVSQYGIKSLTVEPLKDDWYQVKYRFSADSDEIVIPVKACDCDGEFKIVDISWNGLNVNGNSSTRGNNCCSNHCDSINADSSYTWPHPYQDPYYLNGGNDGLDNDLYTALSKTAPLSQGNIQGRAIFSFVISEDGIIDPNSIKLMRNRSVPDDYINAAVEAIKGLGKFEPGKFNGIPKKVRFNIRINYPIPLDRIKTNIE